MYAESNDVSQYSLLNRAECVFAALWHSKDAMGTDAIAKYYEVSEQTVLDTLQQYYQEFESELSNGEWTPRASVRLGLLLTSPVATSVRSLAIDFVEAHKQPSKKESVKFLLQNTQFVEWSNREIGRILECSHTIVNEARRELESKGKVLPFEKRKFKRGDTVSEQTTTKSSGNHLPDEAQNHNSVVDAVQTTESEYVKFGLGAIVKVTAKDHPRYGQECEIIKEWDGHWQILVRFADGEEIAIADTDLDAASTPFPRQPQVQPQPEPVERKYPKQYSEAIAFLNQQHEEELVRLREEITIGLRTQEEERALSSVREQLEIAQTIANSKGKEIAQLQQKIEELESLKKLEVENQQLKQRIRDLEKSQEDRGTGWGNTFSAQAEKVLNTQVTLNIKTLHSLKPELHLESLAVAVPSDTEECLRLMSLAIANLSIALNSTQFLSAAAILLGCEPTADAIASQKNRLVYKSEKEAMVNEALSEIRGVLSGECDWSKFFAIASEYREIKNEYWTKLTLAEQELIRKLKKDFDDKDVIKEGSIVSYKDKYSKLSQMSGTVVGFEHGMVIVHWENYDPLSQHIYEPDELRLI